MKRIVRDLRAKVKRLEGKKREIDDQVAALHTAIRVFEADTEEDSTESNELRDAVFSILQDKGGPLHRTDIYERVLERGLTVLGKNPVNTLGAHLSLDPRFLNVGRGIWNLSILVEAAKCADEAAKLPRLPLARPE